MNRFGRANELVRELMKLWNGVDQPRATVDAANKTILFVYSGPNWQAYVNAINQVSDQVPGHEQSN